MARAAAVPPHAAVDVVVRSRTASAFAASVFYGIRWKQPTLASPRGSSGGTIRTLAQSQPPL